jgi:hypothetical protein
MELHNDDGAGPTLIFHIGSQYVDEYLNFEAT